MSAADCIADLSLRIAVLRAELALTPAGWPGRSIIVAEIARLRRELDSFVQGTLFD